MTVPPTRWARAVWAAAEPFTLSGLFSRAGAAAVTAHGLPARATYVLCRAAPMGAVHPAVVTAAFRSLPAAGIAAVLPAAWQHVSAGQVVDLTHDAVASTWSAIADEGTTAALARVRPVLVEAVAAAATAGRPLGAANAAVPVPADPWAAAWRLLTALRELRGDGHVAALVAADLDVPESEVLMTAWAGPRVDAGFLRASRDLDDDTWATAVSTLQDRGVLAADGTTLTAAGQQLRDGIEQVTDEAAAGAWRRLDADRCQQVFDAAVAASAATLTAGLVPTVTPVGAPWPVGRPTVG